MYWFIVVVVVVSYFIYRRDYILVNYIYLQYGAWDYRSPLALTVIRTRKYSGSVAHKAQGRQPT